MSRSARERQHRRVALAAVVASLSVAFSTAALLHPAEPALAVGPPTALPGTPASVQVATVSTRGPEVPAVAARPHRVSARLKVTPSSVLPREPYAITGRLPKGERHHRHRREVVAQTKRGKRWVTREMTAVNRRGYFTLRLTGARETTKVRIRAESDYMFRRATVLGTVSVVRAAQRIEITHAPNSPVVIGVDRDGAIVPARETVRATIHPRRAGVAVALRRGSSGAMVAFGLSDRSGSVSLPLADVYEPKVDTWQVEALHEGRALTRSRPITVAYRKPTPAEHCAAQQDISVPECMIILDLRTAIGLGPLAWPNPCAGIATCGDGFVAGLRLSGRQVSQLPDEVMRFPRLERLTIEDSGITALPDEIAALSELRELTISDSPLGSLTPSIGELAQLRSLRIVRTDLASLPPELGRLTALEALVVRYGKLTGVPPDLVGAAALRRVELSGNPIVDPPLVLGQLPLLTTLFLSESPLRGDMSPIVRPIYQRSLSADPETSYRVTTGGTGCVHVGGDELLEAWLGSMSGLWRGSGCSTPAG